MEIDHDFDLGTDRLPQRVHHARGAIDIAQTRRIVSEWHNDDLKSAIASPQNLVGALDELLRTVSLVNRTHVAKAEMSIDTHFVSDLSAEQSPDRNAKRLAEYVPQRDLDPGDRAHADSAETPEAVLLHDPHQPLDIARVAFQNQGRKIFDGADD